MPPRRVTAERDGGLLVLTLAQPGLTLRACTELADLLQGIRDDRAITSVLLQSTAAGQWQVADPPFDPADCGLDPASALAALSGPVVVAAHGSVASVGLEIALAADVRICEPSSTFALADVHAGRLPSWGGTQRLPRAVGRSTATAMILLGAELDAATALGRGLVHEVAPDPGARGREIAAELQVLSPLALEYGKEAIREGMELSMRDGMRLEATLNTMLQVSQDRAEGLAAFFAKRDPDFHGR